jgi:hypothetical protein
MSGSSTRPCPGCADSFDAVDGPVHPYMVSSPGCWAAFGERLAADYSSPARMAHHQVVVDAYAAQHPGDATLPQQVQSVGLHLMTLCLVLEHGANPGDGPALHRGMVRRPAFFRLERSGPGRLTVRHVPVDGPIGQAALEWGAAVWQSYEQAHPTVHAWLAEAGF